MSTPVISHETDRERMHVEGDGERMASSRWRTAQSVNENPSPPCLTEMAAAARGPAPSVDSDKPPSASISSRSCRTIC